MTGLGVASPIGIGIGVGQFWKAALVRHPSPTRPRRPTTRRRPRMERGRLTLPRAYANPAYIAPAPVQPRVVQYPHGRYVLRGDGITTAYQWVWIPNPPSAPPAAPPAPSQ